MIGTLLLLVRCAGLAWRFASSRVGPAVLAALLAGIGVAHLEGRRTAAREAHREALIAAANAEEHARRLRAIDAARKNAERAADAIAATHAETAALLKDIDHASVAHDRTLALGADSVRRIDAAGRAAPRARRTVGRGTR